MVDKETEKDICRDYKLNEKIRQIANDHNVTQATVMAVLRRNSIPLRNKKRVIPKVEKAVISLYKKGESIKTIIKLTSVKSERTIYRILSDHDVKRRRNTSKE